MRLTNVKIPKDLEDALENTSARLGLKKSPLHRAALRFFLATNPSREQVLELDAQTVPAVAEDRVGAQAAELLGKVGR